MQIYAANKTQPSDLFPISGLGGAFGGHALKLEPNLAATQNSASC